MKGSNNLLLQLMCMNFRCELEIFQPGFLVIISINYLVQYIWLVSDQEPLALELRMLPLSYVEL